MAGAVIRTSLAALAIATASASPAAATRYAPLAPELARLQPGTTPSSRKPVAVAWAELGAATVGDRQKLRWNLALALLDERRPDEARGVLAVLAADEPDLRFTAAWRLAAARAAAELALYSDTVALLDDPQLGGSAEACAWRLRALFALGGARSALAQLPCAKPYLAGLSPDARAPFLWATARAALTIGRPDAALHFLRFAPADADEAKLLRAEALLHQKLAPAAERLLKPLASSPHEPIATAAEALRIEAAVQLGTAKPADTLARAEALLYRWRGDAIERRLAVLRWDLALAAKKPRSGLAAAATLLRFHPEEPRLPAMLGVVQGSFRRWLAPGNTVPLPLAAGLMWDYRDLLPSGPAGDSLVRLLADRLASEGLHARAADLLEHQLATRARDLAQGPLSSDIAQLRLLAGQPDKARQVIRASADVVYPEPWASSRARLEAIALFQMGEAGAAIALLDDMPGTHDLREELLWRAHDWQALARQPVPASPGRHDAVTQVRLMRQAIALSMIGDEDGLARLRARNARGFTGLPSASAFAAVSGASRPGDAAALASALAALPSVSPAGGDADLLDLSDAALKARQAPPSSRG